MMLEKFFVSAAPEQRVGQLCIFKTKQLQSVLIQFNVMWTNAEWQDNIGLI